MSPPDLKDTLPQEFEELKSAVEKWEMDMNQYPGTKYCLYPRRRFGVWRCILLQREFETDHAPILIR